MAIKRSDSNEEKLRAIRTEYYSFRAYLERFLPNAPAKDFALANLDASRRAAERALGFFDGDDVWRGHVISDA